MTEEKKEERTERATGKGKISENEVYAAAVIGFAVGVILTMLFFMGSQHYQTDANVGGAVISDTSNQLIIDFPSEEIGLVRYKEGGRIDIYVKSGNGAFLAKTLNGSYWLPLAYQITWEIPSNHSFIHLAKSAMPGNNNTPGFFTPD